MKTGNANANACSRQFTCLRTLATNKYCCRWNTLYQLWKLSVRNYSRHTSWRAQEGCKDHQPTSESPNFSCTLDLATPWSVVSVLIPIHSKCPNREVASFQGSSVSTKVKHYGVQVNASKKTSLVRGFLYHVIVQLMKWLPSWRSSLNVPSNCGCV